MENDLITQALKHIHIQNDKDLSEVQHYLKLKYRMDIGIQILEKRLQTLLQKGQAVA